MDLNTRKIFKTLDVNKIWIPIIIGLGIVFLMLYLDEDMSADKLQLFSRANQYIIILAVLSMLARDIGYVYRIRTVSNKELSWNSSIYVIILWEFASSVTPSVVGGTAAAVFIIMKEGIKLGRSLAYTMLTAILDNMFYVVAAPIVFLFVRHNIFPSIRVNETTQLGSSLEFFFYLSYGLIAVYTFVMFYAIFINPRAFKWLLLRFTSFRYLRKWRYAANEQGNEIIIAASILKGKPLSYWLKVTLSTVFIWCARYATLNFLIAAFVSQSFANHLLIFGRQIIMWITMLISPTPGASGAAEFLFPSFFTEFIGDYTLVTMIAWRALSYYPYLILGAIFLPRWIRRVFFKKK